MKPRRGMRLAISFLIGVVFGAVAVLVFLQESGRLLPREPGIVTTPAPSREISPERPLAAQPAGVPPPRSEVDIEPPAEEVGASPAPAVTPLSPMPPEAIAIPVVGVRREELRDHFHDKRGGREHRAIDIAAPRGTPVIAAVDGKVRKLFLSRAGGITVYQFDRSEEWVYYYAHLDDYAPGLSEGTELKKGDVIGYVGTTGNAPRDAPHLHFGIERLGPAKEWWKGETVNPYPMLVSRGVTFAAR